MAFQKAVRSKAKLRLALCGPSGSGKSYTALRLAHALAPGGKIAVLDTERGSASLYAGQTDPDDRVTFDFDVDQPRDYSPETFVRSIREAADAGYDVLILDSITHAWEGVKDEADKGARKKGGNTWAGWADARPQEKAMLDAMLQFNGHVIATARVKTTWEIVEVKGKKEPRKIGLAPEQKQGIEYEFTLAMDMDTDHVGIVTKSRCSVVADAVVQKPGAPFAKVLLEWLETGAVQAPATQRQEQRPAEQAAKPANGNGSNGNGEDTRRKLYELFMRRSQRGISPALTTEERATAIQALFHVSRISEMDLDQAHKDLSYFSGIDDESFEFEVLTACGRLAKPAEEPPHEEPPPPKAEQKPAPAATQAPATKPANARPAARPATTGGLF
jgi:hypothetical protein